MGENMRNECGTVIDVQNNYAILEIMQQDTCASCAAHEVCAALGGGKKQISVINSLNAKKGDEVEICISDRGSLISALIVYVLPILLLLAGMVCGSIFLQNGLFSSDGAMAVGGTSSILIAFGIIKLINPIIKKMNIFRPNMLRIIRKNDM